MSAYREQFVPESDDEIAALADLARRVRAAKSWTIIPLVIATAIAMATAIGLHTSGYLALGPATDGMYVVSKGSILTVALLAGVLTFVPGWLLARAAMWLSMRTWRARAADRFNVSPLAMAGIERMFR